MASADDAAERPGPELFARARRGVHIAPFDELYDPALLADLAANAEDRGWHGFFLWDHLRYSAPTRAVADPWVALAAIASATRAICIGALVTPLSRRRVHKVARETVTLDHLSRGRLVFGAGLGSDRHAEFSLFAEICDDRQRAGLLDAGLDQLSRYWAGELEPAPVQRPRIPVWLGARWPNRRPVRRAAHWDGVFPIDLPGPSALAEIAEEIRSLRAPQAPRFEFIVTNPYETDPGPWEQAGATWCLTDSGSQPQLAQVRAAIDAGPG